MLLSNLKLELNNQKIKQKIISQLPLHQHLHRSHQHRSHLNKADNPESQKPLADLMAENKVTVEEIQQAVSSKGIIPKILLLRIMIHNLLNGVLVGAWSQVFQIIQAFRDDLPF